MRDGLHRLFLVGEALLVRLDVMQRPGGVAHNANWLAGTAMKDSISLMECASSARSHIGPWPPG